MQTRSFFICLLLCVAGSLPLTADSLTPMEELGKSIFFDQNLSQNGNQSCASCHSPDTGFTGPIIAVNEHGAVYEGSITGHFGNRKPPSAAYATLSPIMHYELDKKGEALFEGGNFWNGRATGEKLGNPAADQAQFPFLNPLEQALDNADDVVERVCSGSYFELFEEVWGAGACDGNVSVNYDRIALSLAAYEGSDEVNAFTSKYDYYLKGMVALTKEERMGLNLFKGKGKCSKCHVLDEGEEGTPPLFTDFTFDNLGVPRNPENPFYTQAAVFNPQGNAWVDQGLGEFLLSRGEYQMFADENFGKQKVPTLRNVDKRPDALFVKAYTHNGYFKSLKEVVHFYNTRDKLPTCENNMTTAAVAMAQGCWPAPEVVQNVNKKELGNLHLTDEQEDEIVAFLKTLSDGYQP